MSIHVMSDIELLRWLNWFYLLELTQVDLYMNQARRGEDKYASHVLIKMAKNEFMHAEKIKNFIYKTNNSPYKIISILSKIYSPLSKISIYTELDYMFYISYKIESLAKTDYGRLIKKINNNVFPYPNLLGELTEILTMNMIDEDMHLNWFKNRSSISKKHLDSTEQK